MEAKQQYQQHKDPFWWGDDHESTWTRIKDAMRRDWEQTKADFGSDDARDLGQGVGDTVKQATGKQPFPKSPEAIAELQEEAQEARQDAAEARLEARQDLNEDIDEANRKYQDKVADAREKVAEADAEDRLEARREASEKIQDAAEKRQERIDDAVEDYRDSLKDAGYYKDWRNVSASMRFGAGAAVQYRSTPWTPEFERKLEADWLKTDSRYGWTTVRKDVRRGYERADLK